MKNKKKWIISTGIVIGILAIAIVVLVFIRRKNDDFKCPVTGVKLGMDYKEVERILEKKELNGLLGRIMNQKVFL